MKKLMLQLLVLLTIVGCSQNDQRDPVEKQASALLNKAESSAIDLQRLIKEIEGVKRYNTPQRMTTTIQIVDKASTVLDEADKDINNYIRFINNTTNKIHTKGLSRYVHINDLFNDSLVMKRKALREYFNKLNAWLAYSHKNFDKLKKKGGTAQRAHYERLLYEYHRALNRYNTAQTSYLIFVKRYLSDHPELVTKFGKEYKLAKKELNWD